MTKKSTRRRAERERKRFEHCSSSETESDRRNMTVRPVRKHIYLFIILKEKNSSREKNSFDNR